MKRLVYSLISGLFLLSATPSYTMPSWATISGTCMTLLTSSLLRKTAKAGLGIVAAISVWQTVRSICAITKNTAQGFPFAKVVSQSFYDKGSMYKNYARSESVNIPVHGTMAALAATLGAASIIGFQKLS